MDASKRYDIVILGGGCAGLSLAVELLEQGYGGRLLVVEPRETYERDRTWCYWSVIPHPFQDCVTHSWTGWSIRTARRWVQQTSERYRYEQIPAERFYASANARLDAAPRVERWMGTRAESVLPTVQGFEVATDRGPVTADLVFDSRPPRLAQSRPKLTQHFLGWRVRTDRAVFDPESVTLMDFGDQSSSDIGFSYVLPYSEREALVESTFLSPRALIDTGRCQRALGDYMRRRFDTQSFEILYQERGAIPMGACRPPRDRLPPGYYPIGTRGGAVRPSTGYAFLAIQRWSKAAAKAIVAGQPARIPRRSYSALSHWLDGIFLQRLLQGPETAVLTFCELFELAAPDATVRFLSDQARIGDYLEVIAALPTMPFLKIALKTSFGRTGQAPGRPVLDPYRCLQEPGAYLQDPGKVMR